MTGSRTYDVAFYLPSLGPLIEPHAAIPFAGGAETQIWLLARGLAAKGYAVCVIVRDTPDGLPSKVAGVDIVIRPPWQGGRGLPGHLAEVRALWRTLSPLRSRIVVQRAAGFGTGLVGAITRARGRTFVYSSANIADFAYERLASSRKDLRLFHLGVALARLIVVQTNEQATQCQVKFGRSAIVIGSIAETAAAQTSRPDVFLWIGRLVDYKRPRAFLELARALPEARFRMVGLGSGQDARLEQQVVREAREIPNLELLATRPRPQLLPLYESAVAVVNTADWEGMPNIFLEGWARGVPALALAHDPDGVITSQGLGAFAAGSPQRLAALARELWSFRDDRAALARRCRDYVLREHGAESVVDQWISALGLAGTQIAPTSGRQTIEASAYAQP